MKNTKEVDYKTYCKDCEHYEEPDGDDPCDECLATPMNYDSHKPVNYINKGK